MHIIDEINQKVQALVDLGLTDETKVRKALTTAITERPNRNPSIVLQQQYVFMENNFYGGDTTYVTEV